MLKNHLYEENENLQFDKRKTMTVKEFMEEYQIGHNKAYEIIHVKDFPVIFCGKRALIIRSKIDNWLELHIGDKF